MAEDKEQPQIPLFETGEWWELQWKGMPAFKQKDLMPFKTIYVHFETRADMEAFSKLIGQQIGLLTKSVWYPEADIAIAADKQWVDEQLPSPDEPLDYDSIDLDAEDNW